jgi:hypothetical protein
MAVEALENDRIRVCIFHRGKGPPYDCLASRLGSGTEMRLINGKV